MYTYAHMHILLHICVQAYGSQMLTSGFFCKAGTTHLAFKIRSANGLGFTNLARLTSKTHGSTCLSALGLQV